MPEGISRPSNVAEPLGAALGGSDTFLFRQTRSLCLYGLLWLAGVPDESVVPRVRLDVVGLRYLHTYVHPDRNDVLLRFRVYLASWVVLTVTWMSLFVRLGFGT